MVCIKIMKKVDKKQWFVTGLTVLEKEGFARITIDNLCGLITNYQRCILSSFQKHRRLCGCADEVIGWR